MPAQTTILSYLDEGAIERWDALWRASPLRTAFSRLDYVAGLARALKLEAEVIFVQENGVDVAGAALHWRRRGPYREVMIPPFTPFSAVLVAEESDEAAVHARRSAFERLLEAIEKRFDVLRLHLPPPLEDVRPALWRGWRAQPLFTYRLSLTPGEDPTHRWSASTSRNFRRDRANYRISDGADAARGAVRLCAESYARHGRSLPLAPDTLAAVIERLRSENVIRSWVADRAETGAREAGLVAIVSEHDAYYWVAGSVPGSAMTVLLGEMLARLRDEGVTRFDFMGANTPTIAEFKRRFGTTLVPYYRILRVKPTTLRLLVAMRTIFR